MYEKILSEPKRYGWYLCECKKCRSLFFSRNLGDLIGEDCGAPECHDHAIPNTMGDDLKNGPVTLENLKEMLLSQLHNNFQKFEIEELPLAMVDDKDYDNMVFPGAYVFYDTISNGAEPKHTEYIAIQPIVRIIDDMTLLKMTSFSAFMNVCTECINIDAGSHMRIFFTWLNILGRIGLNLSLVKLRFSNQYINWGTTKTKADVLSVMYHGVEIGHAWYAQMPIPKDRMTFISDISFCLEHLALAINTFDTYIRQMYPLGISVHKDADSRLRVFDDIRTATLLSLLRARPNKHAMGQEFIRRTRRLADVFYDGGMPMLFTVAKFYYKQWLDLTTVYDYDMFDTVLHRLECQVDTQRKHKLAMVLKSPVEPNADESYLEFCRRLVGCGYATATEIFLANI